MASNRAGRAVQPLHQVAALSDALTSDGQLLAAFLAERDEVAFAALVRRYGWTGKKLRTSPRQVSCRSLPELVLKSPVQEVGREEIEMENMTWWKRLLMILLMPVVLPGIILAFIIVLALGAVQAVLLAYYRLRFLIFGIPSQPKQQPERR